MNCPHCGKEVRDGAKFCQHCGSRLTEAEVVKRERWCPSCGALLPDGAKFCNKCGLPLRPTAARQVQTAAQPVYNQTPAVRTSRPQKRKSRFSGFTRALSLLLAAALLVTGLWKPGFMLPWIGRIGIFKPANPKVAYNTDSLVLDRKETEAVKPVIATLSMDEPAVTVGEIKVDFGVMEGEHTLEIRDVGIKRDNSEDAEVHVYDFRLDGGKTQPDTCVAVTVPYNPENMDPYDTVTARHYDAKTKSWTVLPAEFDTDAKTVTFWTDHFSEDGIYDTWQSRLAIAEYEYGAVAGGSASLEMPYQEYKQDGTGFDPDGAGTGAAIGSSVGGMIPGGSVAGAAAGFYIGGKMAEWNNDEPFLYNQKDIQEGKGALSRVTFNANRLNQIAKNINTQFDSFQAIAKEELNWQNDTSVAGKAAVATGFGGNAATASDNIQQVFSSMGRIAEGTSAALSKAFFAVGAVLTAVKFSLSWYDNGSFTSALWDNAADIGLVALGALSLGTGGAAGVAIGIVAAGLWAVTSVGSAVNDSDFDYITGLRNGHYDNDTQRTYMVFTTNYISYSAQAENSGKWPGGLTFSKFPASMEKTRDYIFNTYKTYGFDDSWALGNESYDKGLTHWRSYLKAKADSSSKDTAQLAGNIDACFANAAGVFWKLPTEVRQEFAKDIKAYNYQEPDSGTRGTYTSQMKQVLSMLNSDNIKYFYEQRSTKAKNDALRNIDELTKAMNTVTSFSFFVKETDGNGREKKVPLAESQYKGYIAAFCEGKESAPRNAGYGTVDDWIFETGKETVQFQCTAYNWLKSGGKDGQPLGWVRLFPDENALKRNVSAAEASFEFANGGVEVVFGASDDIEGEYAGTVTPTGFYLGDLWYKVWGEKLGLSREDCADSVSMSENMRITGVTVAKGGLLSGGKYKLTFHMLDTEEDTALNVPVDAEFRGGKLIIKNDKGTTSISVIQESGKPTRLEGTGVIINFDKTAQAYAQMYLIIDISVQKRE